MKKTLLAGLAAALLLCAGTAQAFDLPAPDTKGGKPLMQTLAERQTRRDMTNRPISDKLLGDMLWAACGVNRENGRLTIPTAQNRQDLEVYVVRGDGAWRYDAAKHALDQVSGEDLRPLLGGTGFVKDTPVTLVYVTDSAKNDREDFAAMHAGSAYQNVGLFCASAGLHNVVRASYDAAKLTEALKLPPAKKILITQSVGWGK